MADLAGNEWDFSALCWVVDSLRLWHRENVCEKSTRFANLEEGVNMQTWIVSSDLL